MGRIFSVRINLDEMFAQLDALDHGREKLLWLEGFRVGSRGTQERSNWGAVKRQGAKFGYLAFEDAVKLSQRQSIKADTLWEKKREADATALPRQSHGVCPEHAKSSNPREPINPRSEESNSAKPKHSPPSEDIMEGMDVDAIELAKPLPAKSMRVTFRDWNMSHPKLWFGRNGEQGGLEDWTAFFDKFSTDGLEALDETYAALIGKMEPGKKINYSAFIEYFNENYEVAS